MPLSLNHNKSESKRNRNLNMNASGDLLRTMQLVILIFISTVLPLSTTAQDYDVSEIQCSFATTTSSTADMITARLKKPVGFKGSPLFADDRGVNPEIDRACSIRPETGDPENIAYVLKITDLSRCGVLKRNGFVHVRIWFPQFPGVVMQSDQELIIMCKPPEPTVIQNKAAGFAGSFPGGARVSGVVEETPGRLEYEVALYKEAPPIGRINSNMAMSAHLKNQTKQQQAIINQNELPVDQAVPIGTKLQLRARISTQSVWKFVKLMEVTVSPDPDDPHASGSVALVREGCRNRDFASIIPHQPARYRDRSNEVFLDFEAFLLSSMRERSTLWIHSQIKACMEAVDCQPDFCLDLFEPSGHGRKRRSIADQSDTNHTNGITEFAKFKENIEYSVMLPGDYDQMKYQDSDQCKNFILISGLLALLLTLSTILSCALVSKIQNVSRKTIDDYVPSKGYAGRAVLQ
ncbi:uncharacterized protein LOC116341026 [Contarinia nasturtii]|uniref:uncharacterized protein LOC116341026 n=1 Tax=Contarinia nasturtii TaxID=265458 RepID=UPI0012D3921F|nr:uncharacterized protein LOC116341026 [Contarinia nasturtii]XP_031623725.1 uncharacterized protein LOC116341026 [Contarinia nasturtii]XP_031623726.1 uncharacterized protein LOC116341026 [Contarinia nasturtii]XP_031623727.1 uncharacterized protein LOC116341026 [Contarinia nasturtii]XP_031623728.1 uncharacterized protein LOC116341026 [Contarinia nasturtii]